MWRALALVLLLAVTAATVHCNVADPAHMLNHHHNLDKTFRAARTLITSLPGLSKMPPFNMYTGYITVNVTHGRDLFYWFVESQNNPSTDPFLLWLQGGPGCSSLYGLFLENGPIIPTQTGLKLADFSWNKFANVIYLESPAGVGFSYSNTSSDYLTDNTRTAEDNRRFLELFFRTVYPEYSKNDFWIAGESYGGDYVPQLAAQIIDYGSPSLKAQLKGFMIGNPVFSCKTWAQNMNTILVNNYFYHGIIPYSALIQWSTSGCVSNSNSNYCNDLFNNISNLAGVEFNTDNVYYNFITGNASLGIDPFASTKTNPQPLSNLQQNYLNQLNVQQSIHVELSTPNTPNNWTACCAEIGQSGGVCALNYTNTWTDMLPFYEKFFVEAPKLRILIYSGTDDVGTCPYPYTQVCLNDLNRPVIKPWQPWTINNQYAGYVEVHDKYTFATLKGAGHEAPLFQPMEAYTLISTFMAGKEIKNL